MKNRPSEPIIALILQVMNTQGINTATLAKKVGLDKRLLKKILSGQEVLTVDQLMLISAAIELSEEYLEQLNFRPPVSSSESPQLPTLESIEVNWEPEPNSIHARQLLKMGFALGADILFTAKSDTLSGFGIPDTILAQPQFQPKIPIRLDAAYHQYYKPMYSDDGVEIRLSFDAVYTCFFPWHSIDRISFFVEEEAPAPIEQDDATPAPFLRVIK